MSETATTNPVRSIRIAILAMGGEGGGVLAGWIIAVAEAAGYMAQLTSVPGVAQRTGATNYYIELFPQAERADGLEPVLALTPFPGDVDLVLASELMEAGRAIQRGLVTPDRTVLITSTARVYTMTERLAMGDDRVETDKLLEASRIAALRLVALDLNAIAERAGSVISAAMLGALAGARALPFERIRFEAAIERGGVGVEASKRAFAAAFDAAVTGQADGSTAESPESAAPDAAAAAQLATATLAIVADVRDKLPTAAHAFAVEGVTRLVDYQDADYARLYLQRLGRVAELDVVHGDGTQRLTVETARWLALGMAYEDTIRVAEIKIRSSRIDGVRKDVRARDGQIVEIAEFLHPRLQEIAESVPAPLGRFLQRNGLARRLVNAMTRSGRIVTTTSIRGFVLLSAVASLKPRRRSSLRYAEEQAGLEAWLSDIEDFAPKSYDMAFEIAECRRLVKGYGDTHARGKANYSAIIEAARRLPVGPDAAAHVAMLRHAALEDEAGEKLKGLLAQIGGGSETSGEQEAATSRLPA